MASASASTSLDTAKKERLSFAKIAAAGIKPPNVQQSPSNNATANNHKNDITSSPRDGAGVIVSSTGPSQPPVLPKQKKLVQLAQKEPRTTIESTPNGPEVRVQIVDSNPRRSGDAPLEGMLSAADDAGTQVSSSDSNKPSSLDGKSVASGTTFNALDEKDSLRPDDSASVKAADDEDMYSASGSGMPSRIGSDDGVRAFRDQLREISSMEPSRRAAPPPQVYGNGQRGGVLYVPPSGPGIGPVPSAARNEPTVDENVDFPPDQKLLEALESPRDRVWVLKLEQDVIDFVKDAKESSLTLPACNAFYRLLAHKMADYYMLGHLVDDATSAVKLYKTPNCRIPPPLTGITAPSTAASTPPPTAPAMKILRRGVDRDGPAIANGSNIPSKNGSENGDSGDDKKPKPVTREEREARYEAARLRIMGSAKPVESPEAPKEKQESRSSSTNGKKNKKKARTDSEDGFEARSAYSNYYATPYGSDGVHTPSYGFPDATNTTPNQYSTTYTPQGQSGAYSQMQVPSSTANQWSQQAYPSVDATQAWAQGQTGAYDLSGDFQRAMSFQNQVPSQPPNMNYEQVYGQNYAQQYYPQQQAWQQPQPSQQQQQQPQYPMHGQPSQASYGYGSSFTPSSSQPTDPQQPYAFGQLPSQAFPGRPPSKTEHPLPGSYKGKTFNPQSSAFVPGQTSSRPFTPSGPPSSHGSFSQQYAPQSPAQIQRHSSAQSQASSFGSPHQPNIQLNQNRAPSQPLTHPLPQGPVFAQQPSPGLPLPPKPGTTSQHMMSPTMPVPNMGALSPQSQSSIAKWGAPASLPAKPPPTNEPFDAAKISQIQRQPFSSAAAARQPANGYQTYGAMSPGHVNGSGMAKR